MRLFKVFLKRAMALKTKRDLDVLCGDIDYAFQSEKIKADENEILYQLINQLYCYDRRELV